MNEGIRGIMDASPMGMMLFGGEGHLLHANLEANRIFAWRGPEEGRLRCGEFIGCAGRRLHERGCGYGRNCSACLLSQSLQGTLRGEGPYPEREIFLERDPDLAPLRIRFKVRPVTHGRGVAALVEIRDNTPYKEEMAALERVKAELSAIYAHAPMSMLLVDRDLRIRRGNAHAARFAGRTEEEMLGLCGGEALRCAHAEEDPRGCGFAGGCSRCVVRKAILETFETGVGRKEVETWLAFLQGEAVVERCLRVSMAPLTLEGDPLVLLFARDITETRRTALTLRQSEENFQALFESMAAGSCIDTLVYEGGRPVDYRILKVNPAYERIMGISMDRAVGALGSELYGTGEPPFFQVFSRVAETGIPEAFETYFEPAGKHLHFTVGSPARGFFSTVFSDITERKKVEEDLRLHSLVLSQIRDRVVVTDLQGIIRYVNDGVCGSLERGREDLLGQHVAILGEDPSLGATQEEILRKTLEEGAWQGEVVNARGDGALAMFDCRTFLVRDHLGEPIALAGISTDVTERRRAEKERETLQSQLAQAQKMESVGRLAGGVAHDFNNLLSVILGQTEMVCRELTPDAPVQRRLLQVLQTAERSTGLVRQLLAFARRQAIAPRVLDLNETLEGMLKMLRRLIGEDIDLVWMPGSGLWPISMDPSQIDQILANLCVNARDAIENVGTIGIETENAVVRETDVIGYPGFSPGEYVLLTVSDNGRGMDWETREKIFDPFFTTKELGMGTGLGLATVYGIVKQNGGFVYVISEPGRGAAFRIYLPRHLGEVGEKRGETQVRPLPRGHETVLLVEDEPGLLNLAGDMLRHLGYTVLEAGSPEEALRLGKEHPEKIHLLISDVVMPGMNGKDLYLSLQAFRPDLEGMFMSGYSSDVLAPRGVVLERGVAFLHKPFSMQALADRVREALEGGLAGKAGSMASC